MSARRQETQTGAEQESPESLSGTHNQAPAVPISDFQ